MDLRLEGYLSGGFPDRVCCLSSGLPELLITDGKPWASSLALRQMYVFGLKFRGSKAEIADGNPKQGVLGTGGLLH